MSKIIKELLAKKIARQEAITALAEDEKRSLTEEESGEFKTLQTAIDELNETLRSENPSQEQPPNTTEKEQQSRGAYLPEEIKEINNICRHFNMSSDKYLEGGLSVSEVREGIMNDLMERKVPISAGSVKVTEVGEENYRRDMADALMLKGGLNVSDATDGSKKFRNMHIKDIMVDCLSRMDSSKVTEYRQSTANDLFDMVMRSYYNPTNAFPAILDEAVKKSYINGWETSGATFDQWVKKGSLSDFKESKNSEYIMGFNGELKAYKPTDAKMPKRKLETYGKQFTMTRQAFVNDDIGFITTMPARYAEIAKLTQNKQCYSILMNNQKIHDGKKLFCADHKNIIETGTEMSISTLQKMIYMLSMQKDLAENQILVKPDTLIVPMGYGLTAQMLLTSPNIETTGNTQATNPFVKLNWNIVEDATMNALIEEGEPLPYFLGKSGRILQIDYLNGQEIPTIRRAENPGVLGFVWDVFLDWGISDLGWQGVVRNNGLPLNF